MNEKLFTVFYMAGISAFFTACVAMVYSATRERIELNERLAERRVVMRVLGIEVPEPVTPEEFTRIYETRVSETEVRIPTHLGPQPVVEGRDEEDNLIAYAFPMYGQGVWDEVQGYMAVEPDLGTIRGLAFHEQNETPGLGAEITEPWFEEQFQGLEIPPEPGPDGRLIRLRRPGEEKGPGDVDAITGATGTGRAVEQLINRTLKNFLHAMREAGIRGNEE